MREYPNSEATLPVLKKKTYILKGSLVHLSAKTVKPKSKLHWSFDVNGHFTLRIKKKRGFLISRGGLNTPYFTMKSKYCLNFPVWNHNSSAT